MAKIYGYARISTHKQNIERQVRNIKAAYPTAIIVKQNHFACGSIKVHKKTKIKKQGSFYTTLLQKYIE